jgi:hypothetical protein
MFQTKFEKKNKNTHFMFNNILPFVRQCGTARHTTDDKITRRMRTACQIPQSADTHPQYVLQWNYTIRTKWDGEPSGYAGNPENWIYL